MLDALGLSTQHEAVYRKMLDQPQLDIAGLSDHLRISPDEVRTALDVLKELALVRLDSDGRHVRIARPQAGLNALLAKAEADIALRQRQIAATRSVITAIVTAHNDQENRETTRRIEGLDAVRERLVELAHDTRTECLSFTSGGAQSPASLNAAKPLDQAALERGVKMRTVYQESFRNDPTTLAHVRWKAQLGEQSRTVPMLPLRMTIIDRAIALVPLDPANSDAGALELDSPGVVAGLVALFEQVWLSGTPFGDAPVRDVHGLLAQESQLLKLLAAGHTDESAARKLAISLRTVQRMMTALTERLDAVSRFQTGVEAVRHGWV